MSHLWWLTLAAAGIIFSIGAVMWLDTATAMVQSRGADIKLACEGI